MKGIAEYGYRLFLPLSAVVSLGLHTILFGVICVEVVDIITIIGHKFLGVT